LLLENGFPNFKTTYNQECVYSTYIGTGIVDQLEILLLETLRFPALELKLLFLSEFSFIADMKVFHMEN